MQQTETLKLNLIETGDPLSPAPLNENAEKLETALAALDGTAAAETAARTAETTALDARVTALELKKVVVGTYIGNASASDPTTKQSIELGFKPAAVLVVMGSDATMAAWEAPGKLLTLTETGFHVRNNTNYTGLNLSTNPYHYVAFA